MLKTVFYHPIVLSKWLEGPEK